MTDHLSTHPARPHASFESNETFSLHQALRYGALCRGLPGSQPALFVRGTFAGSGLSGTVHRMLATESSTGSSDSMTIMVEGGGKNAITALALRAVHCWQTLTSRTRHVLELTVRRLEHAQEMRRAVREVRRILNSGLPPLGGVLEARDFETHCHTNRTAALVASLGQSLGLSSSALVHLEQGAYLHDLGKLCVPDEILKKPGRLTPEERTTMQSHVQRGYDLATHIPGLPQDVLNVIRSHHERWDGGGYPDGLAGTDIPLGARVFAVCDVYDALTSVRPYKHAWSHEEAVSEIERQAGRHFDPAVVRAFLELMARTDGGQHKADGAPLF